MKNQNDHQDEDFINDSKLALLTKTTPLTHYALYTIFILLTILLIWAYFAEIDQVTIGTGKVIPSTQVKEIQSLDGGIVEEILVHEGEIVNKDQILLRLDDTRYKAEYTAGYARYLVLLATVARLSAEAQDAKTIEFPKELAEQDKIKSLETKLFETRKEALQEELSTLNENYENALSQSKMYASLLAKGYSSKLEHLRSLQNASEIKTRIIARQNEFREQVKEDLTKNEGELKSLTEQLQSLRDKMIRATIRSPVYGIVKKLNTNTVGGVIMPGITIMEIVPLTDTLLIQARVQPDDIAFIHVGQKAAVKITAYDFAIYGDLKGRVEYISADTVTDQKPNQETPAAADAYYIVNVRVHKNYLGNEKQKLYIMPGMVATVHIETGKKTVLQYLLKPIIKAKQEALRER